MVLFQSGLKKKVALYVCPYPISLLWCCADFLSLRNASPQHHWMLHEDATAACWFPFGVSFAYLAIILLSCIVKRVVKKYQNMGSLSTHRFTMVSELNHCWQLQDMDLCMDCNKLDRFSMSAVWTTGSYPLKPYVRSRFLTILSKIHQTSWNLDCVSKIKI